MKTESILEIIGGLFAVAIAVISILNNSFFTLFFIIIFVLIFIIFKVIEKRQNKKSLV